MWFVCFSIEQNEWNKFNDEIGASGLTDGVKHEDFVGAEKETSKFMQYSMNNFSFGSRPNCAFVRRTMLLGHCDDDPADFKYVYYVYIMFFQLTIILL